MKKKLISIALAAALCLGMAVPSMAADVPSNEEGLKPVSITYDIGAGDMPVETTLVEKQTQIGMYDPDTDGEKIGTLKDYAKAFKYLCDLSGIECYTVTGTMKGGTGEGGHMWNLVKLNGGVLLVDVTNCDDGTIGASNKLFLKSDTDATTSNADGYAFTLGSQNITYTYDDNTKAIYNEADLTLKAERVLTPVDAPTATTAKYTYDGTPKTVIGDPAEDAGYTLSGNKKTDAGNYTAVATLDSDHKWNDDTIADKKIEWSIATKDPAAEDLDLPDMSQERYAYQYNVEHAIDANSIALNEPMTGAGAITVKYSGGTTVPTDVGTYNVTFDVAEGTNFNAAEGLSIGTLTINQAKYNGTLNLDEKKVRINTAQTGVTVDLSDALSQIDGLQVEEITATEGENAGNLISNVAPEGKNAVKFDVASIEAADATATIEITIKNKNYENIIATLTVRTVDKDDADVSIAENLTETTYGGTFALTAKAAAPGEGTGTWKWETSDGDVLQIVSGGDTATVTVKAKQASETGATLTVT